MSLGWSIVTVVAIIVLCIIIIPIWPALPGLSLLHHEPPELRSFAFGARLPPPAGGERGELDQPHAAVAFREIESDGRRERRALFVVVVGGGSSCCCAGLSLDERCHREEGRDEE